MRTLKSDELSDEDLVAQILKTKNQKLFGDLYDRYAKWVYNKCRQMLHDVQEAEDVTHDIFLKLYIDLAKFSGKSKFSTWLYRVVYNFCINHLKGQPIHIEFKEEFTLVDDFEVIEEKKLFETKYERLEAALAAIDANDRWLLLAKYKDGQSIKELAEMLELGESAIKMRLSRARKFVIEF